MITRLDQTMKTSTYVPQGGVIWGYAAPLLRFGRNDTPYAPCGVTYDYMQTILTIRTKGAGLYEFTNDVARFVRDSGVEQGLLTLFVQHTSCSLCIQENADPDVRRDLEEFFRRLVPSSDAASMRWVRHTVEGPDDMPSHIKAALTAVSLSIPVNDRRPVLGQWQGIYLFEHREVGHTRQVVAHIAA